MKLEIKFQAKDLNPEGTKTGENLGAALRDIGEALVESTKQRFVTSRGPDGKPWKPNADSTLLALLRRKGGLSKKRLPSGGRTITDKGARRLGNKKPLVDTGTLARTIFYSSDGKSVSVGSPLEYAKTHQFGARKGVFGSTSRGRPIPWGNIPARPFIGLSRGDRDTAIAIMRKYAKEGVARRVLRSIIDFVRGTFRR